MEYQVKKKITSLGVKTDKGGPYPKYDSLSDYCRMSPTTLVVECFQSDLLWNVFWQIRFCKVFYGAFFGISSHKAGYGLVPTSLVGLAYNSKHCYRLSISTHSIRHISYGIHYIFYICLHKVVFCLFSTVFTGVYPQQHNEVSCSRIVSIASIVFNNHLLILRSV